MRRSRSLRAAVVAVTLAAGAVLDAQDAKATASPKKITARCVDSEGKPVAGAEVHFFQMQSRPDRSSTLVHLGPVTTGDTGIVEFDATVPEKTWDMRWAYARIPDRLVGAASSDPMDRSPSSEMTIALEPSRTVRGRVNAPPGTRLTDVKVRVLRLQLDDGNSRSKKQFPRQGFPPELQDTLPERFDCGVQADGAFTVRDMPPAPTLNLAITGPGLAQTQWPASLKDPRQLPDLLEVDVPAEAVFAGVVKAPDGKPVAGTRVELKLDMRSRPVSSSFVATTDAQGRFRIGGLPGTSFHMVLSSTAGVIRPAPTTFAPGEQRTDAVVQLDAGVEVRGRVVAAGDSPVAKVRVIASVGYTFPHPEVGRTETDSDGRFSLRLPAGATELQLIAPDGFVAPRGVTKLDVTPDDPKLRDLKFELTRRP